ncbi:hypothetical protein BV25DRAFT_381981 [Artomyces pyxidatus]|uniref:Uncharacterized protein n=1 Tax=Artomyces pyxidatus TaxID=48021 RepID=A0ACB8T5X1_9AGAM|nr:hypothetical protein BV25DRAFT_381981 [Artomyces pyxidatus]
MGLSSAHRRHFRPRVSCRACLCVALDSAPPFQPISTKKSSSSSPRSDATPQTEDRALLYRASTTPVSKDLRFRRRKAGPNKAYAIVAFTGAAHHGREFYVWTVGLGYTRDRVASRLGERDVRVEGGVTVMAQNFQSHSKGVD